MKIKIGLLILFIVSLFSCKDDASIREKEQIKDQKKKEIIFQSINKSWVFALPVLQQQAQSLITNWKEWDAFKKELSQKPKSSITAFQQKSKSLVKAAENLQINYPIKINSTAIKSRVSVIVTQIRMLHLYMNLQNIPDQKVIQLISEINLAINSLALQLEEIILKDAIPTEKGESDMIKMLDTSRAIPTNTKL